MADYINRSELLNKYNLDCRTAQEMYIALVKAPTVDVAPVVHGQWEAVHDGWGRCSNCHRMDSIHENATHCRFCGTKMDGKEAK